MEERAHRAAEESLKDFTPSQEERMKRGAEQIAQEFEFISYDTKGSLTNDIRADLNSMIVNGEADAYLLIPENVDSSDSTFEFRSRRAGDIVVNESFKEALNDAVRSQRLADANISEDRLKELTGAVKLDSKGIDEKGVERDSGGTIVASFVIALMIYITLAIYGQAIMGAVVEEKETRIAEILFLRLGRSS
jgi:ABC-type Na+ efflux pump permease subunit